MPSVDKFGSQGVSKPKSFADMKGGVNAPAKSKKAPKKAPKKQSFMDKIVGGIKSAGAQIKSDFKHATGQEKYTGAALDDYKQRSADSLKAHQEFLKQTSKDDSPSGIAALKNTGTTGAATGDMADQYAENLRRYEEYMKSQQPQGPAVTPDMRRAALDVFESQRGAGQMPYYMAAAAQSQDPDMSPAFQYAAQNYATLGGSQRLGPRPMEMMSVAERRQINDMAQAMADQQAQQMDYQRGMDVVMRGGGKGGPAVMPQTGGQFSSMEELMDFQNKNPHMNLMGEYQRLKALEGGGATMPQTGGGMPRPPLPFASMLSQRFGGFGG